MPLSETWFIEGYVDFELQKYRLLGYLQEVNKYFNETKLYPPLADIIFHYNNIVAFRNNKKSLQEQFPKRLDPHSIQKLEIAYEQILADDNIMQELEQITSYALTQLKGTIENGTEIYEFIEQKTTIEPVGIVPLYKNEGYMLLHYQPSAEIRAYAYTVTLFEHQDARYRGVRIQYIDKWIRNITNTFEYIKKEIIRNIRTLPNPAVYSVQTAIAVPVEETLLPIAKRMLMRQIGTT